MENTNPVYGIEVRQLDEYSSLLVIKKLGWEHAGNYTCEIKNAVETSKHTAQLTVAGTYCVLFTETHMSLRTQILTNAHVLTHSNSLEHIYGGPLPLCCKV